jgi:hypothetical protein
VPGIDQAKALDPAPLEQGKDVATGQGEHGLDPGSLERSRSQNASVLGG